MSSSKLSAHPRFPRLSTHNFRLQRLAQSSFLFLILSLGFAHHLDAQPQLLVIDNFDTDQATIELVFPPAGTSASSTASGPGILGSERDAEINLDAGIANGNDISLGVGSSFLSYAQAPTIEGRGRLEWDGSDGDPTTVDPTGLGGVDLTVGGLQDAILVDIIFDDNPIDLRFEVYSDAGNASAADLLLPGGIFTPDAIVLPIAAFTPFLGAGADFTDVGAVTMSFASTTAPDLTIDLTTTTALVRSLKVDTLIVDDDGDGQAEPGDVIQYTVTVENPDDLLDAAATGVTFTSGVDPLTTLNVGSVTTTQGTVTSGNGPGETTVGVDIGSMLDGDVVTITFDVTINNPLPPGTTEVACQGLVNTDTIEDQPTDDPDDPTSDMDPTRTPVFGEPEVSATKTDALLLDSDGDGQAEPGDGVRYTVVITSSGTTAATGIVFTSGVDPNTTLVVGSVTTTQGTVTSGNSPGNTTVAVNVGTIPGGGTTVTITFDVMINNPLPPGTTMIFCQGIVTGDDLPPTPTDDPDTPAPDDPTGTPIGGEPDLVAEKTSELVDDADSSGTLTPGDTLQYTLTITNTGNAAALDLVVTDTPDVNTTLVVGSVTTTQGTVTTGNNPGDTTVVVTAGILPAGSTLVITFEVTVNPGVPPGTEVANQGIVAGGNIPNTPTDDPETPEPDDPTIDVIGTEGPDDDGPPEIPTLGQWGMLLLIGSLFWVAVRRLRRV